MHGVTEKKKKRKRGRLRQNEGKKGNCVTMQLNSSNEVRHQFQWKQYHYMSQAACSRCHARAGGITELPQHPSV